MIHTFHGIKRMPITMISQIINLKSDQFAYTEKDSVMNVDEFDEAASHIVYCIEDKVIAYTRVCAPGTFLIDASFSRVCIDKEFQNRGYGRKVVKWAMELIEQNYGKRMSILVRNKLMIYYRTFGFGVRYREQSGADGLYLMTKD